MKQTYFVGDIKWVKIISFDFGLDLSELANTEKTCKNNAECWIENGFAKMLVFKFSYQNLPGYKLSLFYLLLPM